MEKEIEELKTFVGLIYANYMTLDAEVKQLRKEMNGIDEIIHLKKKEEKENDEKETINDDEMIEQGIGKKKITELISLENDNLFLSNVQQNVLMMNNQMILSLNTETNEITSSNVYFLDSLFYEGLSNELLHQLFSWISTDSITVLFDSKTTEIDENTMKSIILPQPVLCGQRKNNVIEICITQTHDIFGFHHDKCLDNNHYFTGEFCLFVFM